MALPNTGDYVKNVRDYDAPILKKLDLTVTNSLRRVAAVSECCGHPGEPGC